MEDQAGKRPQGGNPEEPMRPGAARPGAAGRVWPGQFRTEDKAWREQVRREDLDFRVRQEKLGNLRAALTAATNSAHQGASPEEVLELAGRYVAWIEEAAGRFPHLQPDQASDPPAKVVRIQPH